MECKAQRLSKVLAAAGVASRRHCEEIIFSGRVKVNGEVIPVPQHLVIEGQDQIEVDGRLIEAVEKKVYYLLNKPKGYLCSNAPLGQRDRLVVDLFPGNERLFTVGRLDVDTTGLLLVTNDGHFAQSVIHPSADIEKEYLAEVGVDIEAHHMKKLRAGTQVEGEFVRPVSVVIDKRRMVRLAIKEGKKREVRHLLAAAGLPVRSLSRIRIGGLLLGHLHPGGWRRLTAEDKKRLFCKPSSGC